MLGHTVCRDVSLVLVSDVQHATPQEWHDYIFPFGAGNDTLGEELDGRDAIDAL